MFLVGGVQLSDAEPVVLEPPDDTTIENAFSDALALPSLTAIVMLLFVPVDDGVPYSWPLDVLNVAHDGLFVTLKVSLSPFASLAVGVKL